MTRALLLIAVIACGPKRPAPPIANTAPAQPSHNATGGARVIQRAATGGVIELHGNREEAMGAADKAMIEHCGEGRYTIVQEGEEVIDERNAITAWRVHYLCAAGEL